MRWLTLFHERALRRKVRLGERVAVLGEVQVRNHGRIHIGDGVRLEALQAPIDLHAGPGAEIIIEDGVVLESGCSIEALQSVRIGQGARLGSFVKVLDNHRHDVRSDRTQRPPSAAVTVGAHADIGPRSILLPGAQVGARARVGAGTVVSRRIPDGADLHGFPLQPRRRTP
jgi:maltose O-acetyltransferase